MVIALGFEFPGLDLDELSAPREAVANAHLAEASNTWIAVSWTPYRDKDHPERTLRYKVTVPGADGKGFDTAEVTLVADADLFLQLAEMAVDLGTIGMTGALAAIANAKGSLTAPTRALFLSAHDAVEQFLVEELARAEARASAHALVQAREMRKANQRLRDCFKTRKFMNVASKVLMLPGTQKQDLFAKLFEARGHRRVLAGLQAKMDERNRKDGASSGSLKSARKRENYRRLYFEIYAGPHRIRTAELETLQSDMFALFPPALAIIGQVEADLAGWQPADTAPPTDKLRMVRIEEKYDTLLWEALVAQADVIDNIERSLSNRSVPGWAAEYFRWDIARRCAAGSLVGHLIDRLLAPPPGAADAVWEVARQGLVFGVLGFLGKRNAPLNDNYVLARAPLLSAMADETRVDPAGILEATVLTTFLRDLQRAQRAAVQEDRAIDTVWHKVEIALALGSLIVGLVALPFGAGEAILPAGLGWLAVLVTGTLIAGTVILLARTVLNALDAGLRADTAIRDRLIGLGQDDPEALEELAGFITGRRELAVTLARTVVEELIELASQRLLPPLAFALDLRDHFQAMDSLTEDVFGTVETDKDEDEDKDDADADAN